MNEIKIKRVYDAVDEHDGYRILADRLWPRGIAKVKADIDLWEKNIAPSAELRKWFGAKDEVHNQAVVLRDYINRKLKTE